jgi:hypothetical protein
MPLADYLASVSHHHSSFQTAFIQQVVRDFRTYYGLVERLGRALNGDAANASDIAVTELCKASFVMRVGNDGPEQWAANAGYTTTGRIVRRDDSAEPNGDRSASIFSDYAENTKAAGWLWDRLTSGSARRVLALGRVAEHGLLRCFGFRQEVTDIRCSKGPWTRHRNPDTNTWARVRNRAEPKLNIDHWLQAGEWWTVSAMIAGQPRDWHVLPIRPSVAPYVMLSGPVPTPLLTNIRSTHFQDRAETSIPRTVLQARFHMIEINRHLSADCWAAFKGRAFVKTPPRFGI